MINRLTRMFFYTNHTYSNIYILYYESDVATSNVTNAESRLFVFAPK